MEINRTSPVAAPSICLFKDLGFAEIIKTTWKDIWIKYTDVGSIQIEGYNEKGDKVYP
jgi:hypothetical protein